MDVLQADIVFQDMSSREIQTLFWNSNVLSVLHLFLLAGFSIWNK